MREVRSSAFPASAFRCRKHFRAASARGSSISLNCKPKATCCSNRALTTGPANSARWQLELVAILSERRTQPERALSWFRATRSTDGSEVLLPADICLRRPPAQREFTPPFPLSIGSAAGPSREAAALHGLLELIERDAAALWWRGGQFGRSIPPQHEAGIAAENLLRQLRHTAAARRRTWLLDITTDVGVPSVAAVSCRADGSGFAFGLAARPRLEAAVRSAITEMCQLELADSVVATKRSERGDGALNAQDRTHLRRAMINADQCILLQPVAERATHLSIHATEASDIFGLIVQRLEKLGIETFCLDLTRRILRRSSGPRDRARPPARAIRDRHGEAAGRHCANRGRRNLYRGCRFDIR